MSLVLQAALVLGSLAASPVHGEVPPDPVPQVPPCPATPVGTRGRRRWGFASTVPSPRKY